MKPVNERQAERFAEEPELISIKATQALLGDVSDKTVRRLVKTGQIEAVKVGARLMPPLSAASPEASDAPTIPFPTRTVSRDGSSLAM